MSRMRSFLIVGGTSEERKQRTEKIIRKYKISHFDKIVLKEQNVKSIGIDQIRRLQHQLSLKPYSSFYQIGIIPTAEKLTIPAQNALLKLLEEPPKDTIIILSSQNADLLLSTIVSRCQIIRLASKSQIEIKKSIIDHQSLIINHILRAGVGERIKIANEIAKNRDDAIKFCQIQLVIWRKKMLKTRQAADGRRHVKIIRKIQKALAMLEANVNAKLAIENLLLQYPSNNSTLEVG